MTDRQDHQGQPPAKIILLLDEDDNEREYQEDPQDIIRHRVRCR
jgi:hypothetical protein